MCIRDRESSLRSLKSDGQHEEHPSVQVRRVERLFPGESRTRIGVWVDQIKTDTLNPDGSVAEADTRSHLLNNWLLSYEVIWTPNGWRVKEIQSDNTRAKKVPA